MNRRLLVIATTVVALLALGSASAQDDSILQRYDLAIENLEIAVASVPDDGAQARDELERALNALLTLSTTATSPNLVQAMEATFDRTRVAVENQSRTDMAVQTAVLAGGFARLVMDGAFTAAAEGNVPLARARLLHLAQSLGFTAASQEALAAADSTTSLRLAFEAGSAEAIAAELQVAERLLDADVDAAYQSLATAYGESLLVQDSPRLGSALNGQLVAAATALVAGDTDAVREALRGANLELARLASAARGEAPGDGAEQGLVAPVPDELPSTPDGVANGVPAAPDDAGAPQQPADPGAPATDLPSTDAPSTAAPADGTPAAAPDGGAPLPLVAGPDFENAVQQRVTELEEERRVESLAVISRDLTRAGIPAQLAEGEAQNLMDSGYVSLDAALAELEADAARAVAAQRSGDPGATDAAFAELRATYQGALAPLLRSVDAGVADQTEQLFGSLDTRPSLGSHDVSLVAAQTGAVRRALQGQPAPAGHEVELAVDSFWSNWTRVSVMIILGLLAIVPLVLLNLAFGGSNRNWHLVGWSLFLLLVPVFYEALAALATLVARFVDAPWLTAVGDWSMFNSTTGQVVWAALVLVALILAIIGLYGICVQFGLFGARGQRAPAAAATAVEPSSPTGNTTIDWDEEF